MTAQGSLYINNEWIVGSGTSFSSRDSATFETLWQGYSATENEVVSAVSAARKAFEKWSTTSLEERLKYIQLFAEAVQKSNLHELISKEVGKPLWESKSEVSSMLSKVQISVDAFNHRCSTSEKSHPLGKSFTRHKPHGVMAVLGPFNFPGHIPNGHIIPALIAGNTIVFKPSEMTPLVGQELIRCWEQSNLPPGVINMVQGGRDTGRFLSGNRDIDGLLFTGSWETGRILSEIFAKTPEKMLALELGGNNPMIVNEISNVEAGAYIALQSAFLTSGQRCTCTRRLIVLEGTQGDTFIDTLMHMMQRIKIGPYNESPEPFMGPVISERAASHLLAAQEILIRKGGKPLMPMKLLKVDTALLSPGLIDVTNVHARPDDEIFGPLLQVVRVSSFESAISEANHTAYGLTAGLLSAKEEHFEQFYKKIRAGVISWNAPTTGASSAAPFGGIKRSGNFRPSGYYAADYCSYPVASVESAVIKMPEALLPGLDF